MSIWKRPVTIGQEWPIPPNTLGAHLGLKIIEVGPDFLRGTMPVDSRTVQPYGRLHGGASCVLAEELGSVAAFLCDANGRVQAMTGRGERLAVEAQQHAAPVLRHQGRNPGV